MLFEIWYLIQTEELFIVPKIINWQLQTKTIQRKVKKAKGSWLEIPLIFRMQKKFIFENYQRDQKDSFFGVVPGSLPYRIKTLMNLINASKMKRLYLSALGTKNISDWSSYIFFHKSIDLFAQAIFNIRIKEQSDRIWSTTLQKKNFAGCRILAWSTVRQEIALLSPVFERITCITSTYGSPFIMASFLFRVKISNLLQFLTSKYGRLCNANTWICP